MTSSANRPDPGLFDERTKAELAELVRQGRISVAVSILEKMASVTDKEASRYAEWAREELKRVQALPKKVKDAAPQLLATALLDEPVVAPCGSRSQSAIAISATPISA